MARMMPVKVYCPAYILRGPKALGPSSLQGCSFAWRGAGTQGLRMRGGGGGVHASVSASASVV
jgi:hypothetical protein